MKVLRGRPRLFAVKRLACEHVQPCDETLSYLHPETICVENPLLAVVLMAVFVT